MARHGDRDVVRITTAQSSLTEDIEARRRNYLVSMTIRVLCFVSAYFVHGWLRWAFVAGAVFIPYFAVVIANAGRNLRAPAPLAPVDPGTRRLTATPADDDGSSGTTGGQPDGRWADGQWASQTAGSLVHDRTSSGS